MAWEVILTPMHGYSFFLPEDRYYILALYLCSLFWYTEMQWREPDLPIQYPAPPFHIVNIMSVMATRADAYEETPGGES